MQRWAGRTVLVTGASAGIGADLCRALVGHGMKVVGCARNYPKLQEMEKTLEGPGSFMGIECDVSREENVLRLFKAIEKEYKGVDVCINNAGLNHGSASLLGGETKHWSEMLNVNILGLTMCTREAVKSMRSRNIDDGHVINLGSLVGHHVPHTAMSHFYSATKFAVRALNEGIRKELREIKSTIRISSLSPGLVHTEFQERAYGTKLADRMHTSSKNLQSVDVTDALLYLLAAPPHVMVHDIIIRPVEHAA